MSESELDVIKQNLSKIEKRMMQLPFFNVYVYYLVSTMDGEHQEYVPHIKKGDDKPGMSDFFDIQDRLHNKKLYDQECQNWWQYAKSINLMIEDLRKLLNLHSIEVGKEELYFNKQRQVDFSKFDAIGSGVQKMEQAVERYETHTSKLAVDVVQKEKTIEQLQAELDEWREKNRKLSEELQHKDEELTNDEVIESLREITG